MDIQDTVDQVFDTHHIEDDYKDTMIRKEIAYTDARSVERDFDRQEYENLVDSFDDCLDAFFLSMAREKSEKLEGSTVDGKLLSSFGEDQAELSDARDKLSDYLGEIHSKNNLIEGIAMNYVNMPTNSAEIDSYRVDIHGKIVGIIKEDYEKGEATLEDIKTDYIERKMRESIPESRFRQFEVQNAIDMADSFKCLVGQDSLENEPDINNIFQNHGIGAEYQEQIARTAHIISRITDEMTVFSSADDIYC